MKPTKADVSTAVHLLRSAGWLSNTSADFQDAILAGCLWQWFDAGATISLGGDPGGGMFALANGSMSATPSHGASDAPVAHVASAPFWFGINSMISASPRVMTTIARSRCLVARVPQRVLEAIFEAEPGWWRYYAQHMTEIAILSQLVASDLLIRDSRRRCLSVLLRSAGCRTGGVKTGTAELSQDELAAMANMSRQTVGTILSEFAEAGLLSIGYRNIVLHDAGALRAVVTL